MTDEELLKQLRQYPLRAGYALRLPAANSIEALMAERDEMKAEAHAHIEMWGKALRERDAANALLREFAAQKSRQEMTHEEYDQSDFDDAYDTFIAKARTHLGAKP